MRHSIFLTTLLMTFFLATHGQELKFGARATLGTGTINSNILGRYFGRENDRDADIKRYDLTAKPGAVFSVGGFAECFLNDNLSLTGEIALQQQSSNLRIDLMEDDVQDGLTFRDAVESKNRIKISTLSAPLLARYYLKAEPGPYLTGGFTTDLVLGSKIEAEERITKKDFDASGAEIKNVSETRVNQATFDAFGSPRVSLTIGVGTVLKAGHSAVTVDLRYNAGLAKSEMYTSDMAFDDQAKESDVFTVYKQADMTINDGVTLNDFKTGSLLLTVGYRF